MKRSLALVLLACAIFLALPGVALSQAPPPPPEAPPERVVIKLRTGLTAQMLREDGLPPTLHEQGYRALDIPEGMTADEYIAQLSLHPNVESAEADVRVYAQLIPNDPFYATSQANYLASIGAPAAWDLETGGAEVIVAVIDSGMDLNHPEFAGRLWVNHNEIPGNGLDDDLNGCIDDIHGCRFVNLTSSNLACGYTSSTPTGAVADDHGNPQLPGGNHSHGTLGAGALAAAGNNGQGIAGIAWGVRIMVLKALDCGPGFTGPAGSMVDVANAVDYAVRNGAKVINLSLAAPASSPQADIQIMRDALITAKAGGVIVVAAAGNFGNTADPSVGYPAAYAAFPQYDNVLAVAASNPNAGNARASFSSYGPAVSIAAPGVGIAGTARLVMPGGGYGSGTGTSFATPLVSGAVALMYSKAPHLSYLEIIALIKQAASPAPSPNSPPNWAGAGILHIAGALERVPFELSGSALHDWKDIPGGSTVQALVNGAACGDAVVVHNGLVSTYSMRVRSDAVQPGCGTPGATVSLFVTSTGSGTGLAHPQISWPGQDVPLLETLDVSSVSPPWGSLVTQTLGGGWNLVAHLPGPGSLPAAVGYLPANWDAIYRWDPTSPDGFGGMGRYQRYGRNVPSFVNEFTSIARYQVYWVNASNTSIGSSNPCPQPCPRSIQLEPGWNAFLFTGQTTKLSTFLQPLAGAYLQVLHRDNASGQWLSHLPGLPRYLNDFEALHQMRIYWILVDEAVTLNLP